MFYSIVDDVKLEQITQLHSLLGNLLYKHDLVTDSRKVIADDIFIAYVGTSLDGRDYLNKVISDVKPAFILYESGDGYRCAYENSLPIDNLFAHLGFIATIKYPVSEVVSIIGVTGTNGKTSITNWINQIYHKQNIISGVIGTIGSGLYPNVFDYASTTPDSVSLHKILFEISHVAKFITMEVSSHALDQGRVNGVNYEVAIFTNLTQDHLDYHENMEKYYQAKKKLFMWNSLQLAIINIDDIYGERLYKELKQDRPNLTVISYAVNNLKADIRPEDYVCQNKGITLKLMYQNKLLNLSSTLLGKFNLYNLLAVIGYMKYYEYSVELLTQMVAELKSVNGRMDEIVVPDKPLVVVDYAHTPDALENVLNILNDIKGLGQVICVFGCGGNRDKSKRPLMANIADKLADSVIITSDNPRNEDPIQIIQDICIDVNSSKFTQEVDRYKAIELALKIANVNDIVLIAGKGHEKYQEINGVKHYFSDKEVACKLLGAEIEC